MLEDITVIELASVLAGPATGMFFSELGARVIKVENPAGGDVTRSWRHAAESASSDITAYFSAVNWGKQSLSLDIKSAEGREVIYKLALTADIIISSFLPGTSQRLLLDADTLLKINPRLICAEINGYGPDDPRPAYDAIIQAESGFTYLNGTPGNIGKMPVALMDLLAAHQLKETILLALIRRMKTGKGGKVSVSLIESGITALANQATNWLNSGIMPQPSGSEHPNIVPYGTIFTTADDKQLVLAVGTDAQFLALCNVLGILPPEEMFTNAGRVRLREQVMAWITPEISAYKRDDLLQLLLNAKVPAGAVNDMKDVFSIPIAGPMILKDEKWLGLRTFAGQGIGQKSLTPPPHLGQHSWQLLQDLGYTEEEIYRVLSSN
ncbi:MAG: CoA transferase [Bacteroidia bacterium]